MANKPTKAEYEGFKKAVANPMTPAPIKQKLQSIIDQYSSEYEGGSETPKAEPKSRAGRKPSTTKKYKTLPKPKMVALVTATKQAVEDMKAQLKKLGYNPEEVDALNGNQAFAILEELKSKMVGKPKRTATPRATKKTATDIEKAKAQIKAKTGKTEAECEAIIEQYRSLRSKAQEGKRKAEQATATNKKRVAKLEDKGDLIEGTNVKTADAVIETTAQDVAEKIEQQIEAVEEKAEKEAVAEVAKDNTKKTPTQKKQAVEAKVEKKVKEKTKVIVKKVVIDTTALLTSIATSLGKFDKDSQKEFLIKLRSDIDKLLAKYAFGGMTYGAVQTMNVQQSNLSSSSVNPTMFAKGGSVNDIEEGDIVKVKSEGGLKAEVIRIVNDIANVEFVNRRPSGGDKRGQYKLNDLKLVNEVYKRGGIMADGRIVLRTFNGVGGNKNKTYKLIKDDRDSDGKPYYTLIEDQSGNVMAQGDSFDEVNGYANLMSGKFADGGGVEDEELHYWEVSLKMPNGEIVYESVIADSKEDAEYYGELTDSANDGGKVLSVKSIGKEKFAKGGRMYALVDKFDANKQVYDQVYYKTNNYNEIIGYIVDLKNEGKYDSDMQFIEVRSNGRMRKFDISMLETGGVVGQEIVFDYNGEENTGVIKEITNLGDYVVRADNGRTLLAQRDMDVISLGAMRQQGVEQRKKRFGFFEDGGEIEEKGLYPIKNFTKVVNHFNSGDQWDLEEYPPYSGKGTIKEWMGEYPTDLEDAKAFIFESHPDWASQYEEEINDAKDNEELQDILYENDCPLFKMDNTYNSDWWGGVIQTGVLQADEDGYSGALVFVQFHRGGDVRGNYGEVQAFILNSFYEDFPLFASNLTYTIETNRGDVILDTQDFEGYTLLVVEDATGNFEEGEDVTLEELSKTFDLRGYSLYARGGKLWIDTKGKGGLKGVKPSRKNSFRNEAVKRNMTSGQLASKVLASPSRYKGINPRSAQLVKNMGVRKQGGSIGDILRNRRGE